MCTLYVCVVCACVSYDLINLVWLFFMSVITLTFLKIPDQFVLFLSFRMSLTFNLSDHFLIKDLSSIFLARILHVGGKASSPILQVRRC